MGPFVDSSNGQKTGIHSLVEECPSFEPVCYSPIKPPPSVTMTVRHSERLFFVCVCVVGGLSPPSDKAMYDQEVLRSARQEIPVKETRLRQVFRIIVSDLQVSGSVPTIVFSTSRRDR